MRPHQSPQGAEARSAGYAETCSSGATEARRSSGRGVAGCRCKAEPVRGRNPGVLSDGETLNEGDRDRPVAELLRRAVCDEAGAAGRSRPNPAAGVRATAATSGKSGGSPVRPVQPLRRGEPPSWRQAGPGSDRTRGPSASPRAANSSTMKGPRGLAGQFRAETRGRTAKRSGGWVRGRFCIRSPEIGCSRSRKRRRVGTRGRTTWLWGHP